ncbi:MAG: ATP-binding cassette domain-containing protein [Desulfobulbaceae bacterium]|nr:ATP-binding cassette domain-containing protein [Desulfobulbaceae bacterium]
MSSNKKPIVEMFNVTKTYPPDVMALKDISFFVDKGEMLYLTGMSGAGKTTLLKLICGLETVSKGSVKVGGADISKLKPAGLQQLRRRVSMAYQDFKLLPDRTVLENVAMAMEVAYKDSNTIQERVFYLLDLLRMSNKKDTPAGKLSRGEQQRVTIARAAANSPPLILADEPTGNLDPAMTRLVINLFIELLKNGTTVICATHDESIYSDTNCRRLDLWQGQMVTKLET